MPKSKVNTKRKSKVEQFKQKTKKRMNESKIPQLRSFPIWKSQDTINVSGLEWQSIYNALNIFREAIVASESVMQRNTESGVISTKFIDENDQEVPKEKVEEYMKQLQAFYEAKESKGNQEKTSILTAEGEPATLQKDQSEPDRPNELKAV